jgi:hypothetical protein
VKRLPIDHYKAGAQPIINLLKASGLCYLVLEENEAENGEKCDTILPKAVAFVLRGRAAIHRAFHIMPRAQS